MVVRYTTVRLSTIVKDTQVNFRFGEEDIDRLEALAEHYEMSQAQVVRMLIKRDADVLGVGRKKKR